MADQPLTFKLNGKSRGDDVGVDANASDDAVYDAQMAELLNGTTTATATNGRSSRDGDDGEDDGDEDDDPPSFAYPGADPQPDDDEVDGDEFLYPGADADADARGSESNDASHDHDDDGSDSSESYNTRMKAILGGDSSDGDDGGEGDGDGDESLASTSAADQSGLPDRTIDSATSTITRPEDSHSPLSPSSTISSSLLAPPSFRRPPEYPALSRLRSQAARATSTSASASSSSSQSSLSPSLRSHFGNLANLFTSARAANGGAGRGIGTGQAVDSIPASTSASATPSILPSPSHSRSASASYTSSLAARGGAGSGRAYPYGPAATTTTATTTTTGEPSTAANAVFAAATTSSSSPSSPSSPPSPVEHAMFRWSALRRSSLYLQRRDTSASTSASAASGQPLPANLGRQSASAVGNGLVAIGTSSGATLVFEFSQELRCICGENQTTTATSSSSSSSPAGRVSSLAFSADHSHLAVGHAQGHIHIYDLSRPASPTRSVPPITPRDVSSGRKEGHLEGSKILHTAFVGTRHTAVYSADARGLAFYHSLGKILGVASNDTVRVLGRYPAATSRGTLSSPPPPPTSSSSSSSSSPILDMSALPLGPHPHVSDDSHFLAMITEKKVVVVGLKPSARTWYRRAKAEEREEKGVGGGERAGMSGGGTGKAAERDIDSGAGAGDDRGVIVDDGDVGIDADDAGVSGNGNSNGSDFAASPFAASAASSTPAATAACAWYPAYTAPTPSPCTDANGFVPPRLAFAFDSTLYLLTLRVRQVKRGEGDNPAQTHTQMSFTEETLPNAPLSRIHGIRWLSHEFLLLLTATHISLYDLRHHRVTETEPIEPTLHGLIRQTWREGGRATTTLRTPGILSASMQTHQSKVFFLTAQQIIVGHWLTWSDRILALVSTGDFLTAIELATAYLRGEIPGSRVGLSSDTPTARDQVGSKLRQLMSASARYAFSPDRLIDNTHVSADGRGVDRTQLFCNLARLCAEACLALDDTAFLFGDLYDFYSDAGIEGIFVDQMEPVVVSGRMRHLPIPVVQRLLASCESAENYPLAESIIWHVDPQSLDIDQALRLCAKQRLDHALVYVYNAAMDDYVSPVVELMDWWRGGKVGGREGSAVASNGDVKVGLHGDGGGAKMDLDVDGGEVAAVVSAAPAYTILAYLSVTLTGHSFPSQHPLDERTARHAKSTLYAFLFSGHCIVWPPGGGGRLVLTQDGNDDAGDDDAADEPTYPYLRLLLRFDPEAFLDALDVAFEDPYLDGDDDGDDGGGGSAATSRQAITDILIHVTDALAGSTTASAPSHATFVAIFLARNAPKYPQFIHLDGAVVKRLLDCLAQPSDADDDGGDDTNADDAISAAATSAAAHSPPSPLASREDRQLAAESLLSAYKVDLTDDDVLEMFARAGFWRILQSAYRSAGKWGQLTAMILNDVDLGRDVFSQLDAVLRKAVTRRNAPSSDLDLMVLEAVPQLIAVDVRETVHLVDRYYPTRHVEALEMLEGQQEQQLAYLSVFFRGDDHGDGNAPLDASHLSSTERDLYISLLAAAPDHPLVKQLDAAPRDYFDLSTVVECGRRHDRLDAVLWALDRQSAPAKVFDELDAIVAGKASELRSGEVEDVASVTDPLRAAMDMAVRICTERAAGGNAATATNGSQRSPLSADDMWFRLLRSSVRLIHHVASTGGGSVVKNGHKASTGGGDINGAHSFGRSSSSPPPPPPPPSPGLAAARQVVQETLSGMVTSMSAESVSFPRLFRRLVEDDNEDRDASSTSPPPPSSSPRYYAEVRNVVEGMLNACKVRTDLLGIANQLYDRETVVSFARLARLRKRGWRPAAGAGTTTTTTTTTPKNSQLAATPSSSSPRVSVSMSRQPSSSLLSAGPNAPPTKTPSRGMDFLAIDPSAVTASPSSSSTTPIATPRVNKGKGRDRSFDGDFQRNSGGGRRALNGRGSGTGGGGFGGAGDVDDYFGSAVGDVATATTAVGHPSDPSDHFLAAPLYERVDGVSEQARNVDDDDGGGGARATANAQEDHYMYPRQPLTVRLGKVR